MKNVDIIIHTTFLRDEVLDILLDSLRWSSWPGGVLIADTRPIDKLKLKTKYSEFQWFTFPFDLSPAVTRNCLVAYSRASYIFKIDDDFLFNEGIDVQKICEFLNDTDADLVGMQVRSSKVVSPFIYNIERNGDEVELKANEDEYKTHDGMRIKKVDVVPDCWIAKRSAFTQKELAWDERYHVGEGLHPDFFMEAKEKGVNVYYTPDSEMFHQKHDKQMPAYYRRKRMRVFPDNSKFLEKWNITKINRW